MRKNVIDLNPKDYPQKGLYLLLEDSTTMLFTKEFIERTAAAYWNNPGKISSKVKSAVEFQRCPVCPLRGKDQFCDAIRPILPFLDILDRYVSFNEVIAIYRDDNGKLLHVADTVMQDALRYVSLLSLMRYCRIGRQYWRYYFGIIPLRGAREAAIRIYLNMYWLHKGNEEQIHNAISSFTEQLKITSRNQVQRMNLVCKNDVFMNAFVNTQVVTEFLSMDIKDIATQALQEFLQEPMEGSGGAGKTYLHP
jgi:hypothetical protein